MWNETRNQTQVAGAGGVTLESPFVGAADVLKAHQARASKKFTLRERPFLDLVNVRGELSDPAFVAAFERVVGCLPPAAPNTVARGAEYDVLWLGPDEWLVRSNGPVPAGVLEAKLAEAVQGSYAAAVDVGSGYTVVEISGERVRDVIARGCPLDLHPRVFKPGQCAQSHYFKSPITLIPTGDDTFEIVLRRSFADYFVRIMLDAAAPLVS
ncbi:MULTISPECIES: sarcosine oxidase subunit gamma [Burkholderia cepacia complex]|uniref:Sarcosine oxidase subunit gamma n=1 Tax=Burkholderia cenocepacia TaxID=95486 RepID=A0AAD0J064_9BURK|nr:sarcosine oxidase subunit gamma [Burkholderia cenocepacia]EAY66427.1 Sarcosine oxidase, gamma subunit [Burkholderia cenocepacia PC184]AQQ34177.1 sarcosine oxidase subunit gamma [Burkholderia cenocepacia]AWG28782.1 sarcosine oxidase subunit gamma [Burkholderia cenocepacia]MBR8067985.1 sarcosine oxidase subunit gamma [Burkholderia cenocepacia]MBR8080464.1 sarcosine oxidase subunit gamma [Burkholderia cenocepacia]